MTGSMKPRPCRRSAQLAKAQADLAQARERSLVDMAEANLQIAQAQLNKANTDVTRLKPLAEQKAVPQQDYDNALAAQQSAKADVQGRQAALTTSKVNQTSAIQQGEAAVAGRQCVHPPVPVEPRVL